MRIPQMTSYTDMTGYITRADTESWLEPAALQESYDVCLQACGTVSYGKSSCDHCLHMLDRWVDEFDFFA